MADNKVTPRHTTSDAEVVDRAKDFWSRNNKPITIAALALLLLIGGFFGYKKFIKEPNERKASEAIFKAEEYFRMDSLNQALNGDGQYLGFLKVIDKYGATKAGDLARYYAGAIYLQQGNAANAVKYLSDFDSDAEQIQARAYKLLGDAYAEQGKNADALSSYKKAAHHFEEDEAASSEYLFMAAYFAGRIMKNSDDAKELFKELKDKYPTSPKGLEADKYLAQLGVYN